MWETILTSSKVDVGSSEERDEKSKKHKQVLESVQQILEDKVKLDEIMQSYNKEEESISEYRFNRKERILKVLELAKVNPEEYVQALKESTRKGVNIILARDIDELNVNNYNPEWLLAWDGSLHIFRETL